MIHWIVALGVAVAAPVPDLSRHYFKDLKREAASEVKVAGESGPLILIIVDALRPDRMGAYGFARPTSPALDALADDGLILTSFFVNSNWTRPSTATILTGQLPSEHGVEGHRARLSADVPVFPEVLQKRGVPTGAVIGNGNAGSAFGLERGFDYYADTVKHWKGLPSAEEVVKLAVPFVEKHRAERFFLVLFLVDPHDPYHAPGEFETMFVTDPTVDLVRTPHWERGRYTPKVVERMKATYDGAVRYTDTVLGEFFKELRRLGVYDKATIMVTADHGEAFGEHGVFLHSHHFYEELIRVPFILRAPSMSRRGVYSPYLFDTRDLAPTILGHFGARFKVPTSGIDLVRSLGDASLHDPARTVISEFHNFGIKRRAIRTYERKLVLQEPANREEFMATVGNPALLPSVNFKVEVVERYDLRADPFERHPLPPPVGKGAEPWRRLKAALKKPGAEPAKAKGASEVKAIDAETRRDLKAMGYLD